MSIVIIYLNSQCVQTASWNGLWDSWKHKEIHQNHFWAINHVRNNQMVERNCTMMKQNSGQILKFRAHLLSHTQEDVRGTG